MTKTFAWTGLVAASIFLSACSAPPTDDTPEGELRITAAFYPLQYAAEAVGGDLVQIENLTTPGTEAHDMELSPRSIAGLADADLVVHLAGFQPAVDAAIEQMEPQRVLDASHLAEPPADAEADHEEEENHEEDEDHDGHEHGAADPHFWLDPTLMAELMGEMATHLGEAAPEHAATFQANAARAQDEMAILDKEFSDGLASCERDEIFTTHAAFGYLEDRYGLHQIPLAGISPDDEPSPARIAAVQEEIQEYGATTIFFETLASDAVASAIAADLGLETAVLDPLEGLSDQSVGDDYPSVMRANLQAIRDANGCS